MKALTALALTLSATVATAHPNHTGPTIVVSCYQGPLETSDVIWWDRPLPVFLDSLVEAGYTLEEAHYIGDRVCLDPRGVNNDQHRADVMNRLIHEYPPTR